MAAEPDRIAVGIEATDVEPQSIAFADRAVAGWDQFGHAVGRGDREIDPAADPVDAIAEMERDALVSPCRIVIGRPGKEPRRRIECGARRQVIDPDGQHVPVGIDNRQGQLDQLSLDALNQSRQLSHDGCPIAAFDRDGKHLLAASSAAVVRVQHDRSLRRAGRGGSPRDFAAERIDRHAGRSRRQEVEQGDAVRVVGIGIVMIRLAHGRLNHGLGIEHRPLVGSRRGPQGGVIIHAAIVEILDGDRAADRRLAGLQPQPVRQLFAQIDVPAPVGCLPRSPLRHAGIALQRVQDQQDRQQQVVVAGVGDDHVPGDRRRLPIHPRVGEVDVDQGAEVGDGGEGGDVVGGHGQPHRAGHLLVHNQAVLAGIQQVHGQEHRIPAVIVEGRRQGDLLACRVEQCVVGWIGRRTHLGSLADVHRLVVGHRQIRLRQRHQGIVRRIGRQDHRGRGRIQDVDLVRLADQHVAIRRGHDHVPTRAAIGQGHSAQGGQVHHGQFAAGVLVGSGVVRDEQQAFQNSAGLAEAERVDFGFELDHQFRSPLLGEPDDLAAVGPGGGPQAAIGSEGQRGHAEVQIAVILRELTGRRIEHHDAAASAIDTARPDGAGSGVDQIGFGMDRQRHGNPVAELLDHLAGDGVQF